MKSLQGQLLIASPQLTDPNFARSVVLIVQHNEEGALGLILNRPLEATMQDVWEQVSEEPCQTEASLHQGGPCEGPLMAVHAQESLGQMEVVPGIYFSTDREAFEELVSRDRDDVKFFVGHSGWSPGQLEEELESGAWLIAPAKAQHVFSEGETLWAKLRRAVSLLTSFPWLDPKLIPDDPTVN
ncbi:MAG: hypothetical protein JWL69_4982 [Phycisphaerales bacterium]|jgi:putative transcriptional regulator|nr:hypothetical protein [Phycisphaerales bacterium]MDB5356287.1 hypothetical protein [Phycisphaerales bacterium]